MMLSKPLEVELQQVPRITSPEDRLGPTNALRSSRSERPRMPPDPSCHTWSTPPEDIDGQSTTRSSLVTREGAYRSPPAGTRLKGLARSPFGRSQFFQTALFPARMAALISGCRADRGSR